MDGPHTYKNNLKFRYELNDSCIPARPVWAIYTPLTRSWEEGKLNLVWSGRESWISQRPCGMLSLVCCCFLSTQFSSSIIIIVSFHRNKERECSTLSIYPHHYFLLIRPNVHVVFRTMSPTRFDSPCTISPEQKTTGWNVNTLFNQPASGSIHCCWSICSNQIKWYRETGESNNTTDKAEMSRRERKFCINITQPFEPCVYVVSVSIYLIFSAFLGLAASSTTGMQCEWTIYTYLLAGLAGWKRSENMYEMSDASASAQVESDPISRGSFAAAVQNLSNVPPMYVLVLRMQYNNMYNLTFFLAIADNALPPQTSASDGRRKYDDHDPTNQPNHYRPLTYVLSQLAIFSSLTHSPATHTHTKKKKTMTDNFHQWEKEEEQKILRDHK